MDAQEKLYRVVSLIQNVSLFTIEKNENYEATVYW